LAKRSSSIILEKNIDLIEPHFFSATQNANKITKKNYPIQAKGTNPIAQPMCKRFIIMEVHSNHELFFYL